MPKPDYLTEDEWKAHKKRTKGIEADPNITLDEKFKALANQLKYLMSKQRAHSNKG